MDRFGALYRLLTLGGIAWFVLWACAPMMSTPPASPISDPGRPEIGMAAHGGYGFDGEQSEEDRRDGDGLDNPAVLGGATIWYRKAAGAKKRNQAGGSVHGQMTQEIDCHKDYCNTGIQVSAGYPFATLGVPLAWSIGQGGRLDTEVGMHVTPAEEEVAWVVVQNLYQNMPYIGVGYSMPLGAMKK